MKKIVSILVVAVMLVGMLPAIAIPALAATYGDLTYKIENGEVTIKDCDESATGALEIPEEIEGYPVTSIGRSAFKGCSDLTSITISDSVNTIGSGAFLGCRGLTLVSIGDGVTTIGDSAFYNCRGLTSITISGSVASIGNSAFYGCTGLTSVTIGDSVTVIGGFTFYDCVRLTSIAISSSVTSIGYYAFDNTAYYNNASNWENDVLYLGNYLIGAEEGISGSYSIKAGTKVIADNAFYGCTGLTSIIIPDSVTSIGKGAFYKCAALTSITIPDKVTAIDRGVFSNCSSLKSITIPDSVKLIDEGAFEDCANLTSVNFGKNLVTIGSMFATGSGYGGVFSGCTSLTSITIPNSVTTIGQSAFSGCTSLTKVVLSKSVASIGDSAFNNCFSLNKVQYTGTSLERSYISIGNNNAPLHQATWSYGDGGRNPFKDVKSGEYYTEPVLWAVGKKITNGMSETSFAPNNECTRGQIVTFLWRAAGSPEPTSAKNPFVDVKSDQYYYKAVLWAVEKGITTGTSATTFSPDAGCTRGQVVTFLHRAKSKPAANTSNSFTDVKKGAYYYDAVLWAVKNGITNGMGNNKFAPDTTCTRGQIVTFLYRAYK